CEVVCSNCRAPITLDSAACPRCSFTFGTGQVGAEPERRRNGVAQVDPTYPAPVSRGKAGLLSAGGFAVCVSILVFLAYSTPIIGVLIYGALYFASPFAWGWSLLAGLDAPWPVQRSFLPLAFAAPFPVVGLIVGYVWPFPV